MPFSSFLYMIPLLDHREHSGPFCEVSSACQEASRAHLRGRGMEARDTLDAVPVSPVPGEVQHLRGGSQGQDSQPRAQRLQGNTPSPASEPSKVAEEPWNSSLVWVRGEPGSICGGPPGNS